MLEVKQTFVQSCKFGKEQIKDGENKTHRDKEYRSFRQIKMGVIGFCPHLF